MIKFEFSLREIVKDYSLTNNEIQILNQEILGTSIEVIQSEWIGQAKEKLYRSRMGYIRGIQQPIISPAQASITLIGAVPMMIEEGATAFDIKKGFAKSSKRKTYIDKKTGITHWYMSIPYRHATSEAIGDSSIFSNILPKEVYKVLLAKTKENSNYSLDVKHIPAKYGLIQHRKPIAGYGGYKHKVPILQGVKRVSFNYQKAMQSKYVSFRRVSSKSDPNSWIHPGIKARKLAEKALESAELDIVASNTVNTFLQRTGIL